MSTSTGFALGVGTIAVAIGVGFSGGYMLTKTDTAHKIAAAGYASGSSSTPTSEPPVHVASHKIEEHAPKPSTPSLAKQAEASTVGLASAEVVAPGEATPVAQETKSPESAKELKAPAAKTAEPKEEKARSSQRQKRAIAKRRSIPSEKQEQKTASSDAAPDMAEIKHAIEIDIRRRSIVGRVSDNSFP
jgi:hypothetical protein